MRDFLPSTYRPITKGQGVRQERIFDPALKHFTDAFRAGEPAFCDAAAGHRWRTARRTAMDHVLRLVATFAWAEHLVLRGSLLLQVWLGDVARDPGDMDWVVTPASLDIDDPRAGELFDGLVAAVRRAPKASPDVWLDAADITTEDIWTYERAPGRRLLIPWSAPELPPGVIQLDFVFNEELPEPPVRTAIPRTDGADATSVLAVSPELSLAWKILWLMTDTYPQGKDLYDAAMLGRHTYVPLDLLRRVLEPEFPGEHLRALDSASAIMKETRIGQEWQHFVQEYPWAGQTPHHWESLLEKSLRSTFGKSDD